MPGDVIWVDELGAPDGALAWRVLHHSLDVDGEPVATSGWVAVSGVPGPHRIVVFGHGTTGLGDTCAPTVTNSVSPFLFREFLSAGWTVAFTDYQGLGTPGLHHYLVKESAARSVFDVARAARQLDPDATTELALYGFSQGGHAVLSATDLADELAPDFDLVGTVAAAPASLIREWFEEAPEGNLGYLTMIATGYADAFDVGLDTFLTEAAIGRIDGIEDGCLFDIEVLVAGLGREAIVGDVSVGTPAGDLLAANEPLTDFVPTPILLLTGTDDDLFTPEVTDRFLERVCALGIDIDQITFEGASHTQVGSMGRSDALAWLDSGGETAKAAC
jgi:dienelactone hydrolase